MLSAALLALLAQNKNVYPLAPAIKTPIIAVDTSAYPEGRDWGHDARRVAEKWFPIVTTLLATDGRDPLTGKLKGGAYRPPTVVSLIIKPFEGAPAYASGPAITIQSEWIKSHPEDLGMVVHELTHVIQSYPDSEQKPGWLVEGIADYIRWWRYEPELQSGRGRTKIEPGKSKYTDGYRTTALWLAWASRKYNMALVPCLDLALRNAEDPMPQFSRVTGKDANALWEEFVEEVND
ncbi:MAG: hypothetical protein JNK63_01045 [Chthonomonas sp.]|nr:hypothetical protein [Chthonomonas sp.]